MPEGMDYIWHWYVQLHTGETLSFTEIHAWSQLTRMRLSAWEVDLLHSLNRIFLRVSHG